MRTKRLDFNFEGLLGAALLVLGRECYHRIMSWQALADGAGEGSNPQVSPEEVPLVQLKSSGRLVEMTPSFKDLKGRGGEICAIENFQMRGKQWKFSCSCNSPISGEFAVADDRGEVYLVNVEENAYKLVRSAHAPVAAMAFIACRRHQLLISYESGQVVLVDTESKEVLANIQTERSGLPPVRFVRSHPSKPMVVLASDDACVSGKLPHFGDPSILALLLHTL